MGNPIVETRSRSWEQITTVAAVLQSINIANGYLTDVGKNVWTNDSQRTQADALGVMIYSGDITKIAAERTNKPVRQIEIFLEFAIGTDIDDGQQLIHSVIEDIETCVTSYAKEQFARPNIPTTPLELAHIKILDRPEGEPVMVAVATVLARYFR